MEKIGEFRGKTVEAAIAAALSALRLSRDEVEIEVIRPGSRGVLGIGAEDAVVRVSALRSSRPAEVAAPTPRAEPPAPTSAAAPTPSAPTRAEPKPAARPSAGPRAEAAPARPTSERAEKARAAAELGRDLLAGLLERMGFQATVQVTRQSDAEADEHGERAYVLNIVGEDLGVLIGRQNETLSALEFITRLMVNQQSHSRCDLIVDVNGYRAKRAESLRRLALRTAEQVMQNGRTMALEPMPPAERRIIHLALRDHPKVYTQSVGEGDRRKVTVILRKD